MIATEIMKSVKKQKQRIAQHIIDRYKERDIFMKIFSHRNISDISRHEVLRDRIFPSLFLVF
jgi:hypothetical protein